MAQGLISERHISCGYQNSSSRHQIIRISNIGSYFERVILPDQKLLFNAEPDAFLEIYTIESITSILADRISCSKLKIESLSA